MNAETDKQHPHYDLIVQWASEPARWAVEIQEFRNQWEKTDSPLWLPDQSYRLIDLYTEPVTEALTRGEVYWVPSVVRSDLAIRLGWDSSRNEHAIWLRRRIMYRTAEAAAAKAREWIEADGGKIDE